MINKKVNVPNEIFDLIEDPYELTTYLILLSKVNSEGLCYLNLSDLIEISQNHMARRKTILCVNSLKNKNLVTNEVVEVNGIAKKIFRLSLYVKDNGIEDDNSFYKRNTRFYVYIHINKITNEVLYVGKGNGDRYKQLGKNTRNDEYYNYIEEVGKDNIKCEVVKIFRTEAEAYEYEEYTAELFKKIGQNRFNKKIGY